MGICETMKSTRHVGQRPLKNGLVEGGERGRYLRRKKSSEKASLCICQFVFFFLGLGMLKFHSHSWELPGVDVSAFKKGGTAIRTQKTNAGVESS